MIDEIKPISKSWLAYRIRLGERYLRYNLDDLTNKNVFKNLRDTKTILDKKWLSEKTSEINKDVKGDASDSPYDNLSVPQDKPHDIDETI